MNTFLCPEPPALIYHQTHFMDTGYLRTVYFHCPVMGEFWTLHSVQIVTDLYGEIQLYQPNETITKQNKTKHQQNRTIQRQQQSKLLGCTPLAFCFNHCSLVSVYR